MIKRRKYSLSCGPHQLELGTHTCIMGILNITPDSFSDGGQFFTVEDAVAHGEKLVSDGADILDIGGESTRPFSDGVTVEDELQRVIPVIKELAPRISVPISIDTTKARVAEQAIKAGASIINDISAMRVDPCMMDVTVQYNVPVIVMHMLGTPKTMQVAPEYADVIDDIRDFLENIVNKAVSRGVAKSNLIVDPGIGFGKTVAHNFKLIQQLWAFQSLDLPILIGASRKAFIRKTLQGSSDIELQPDNPDVEIGSQSALGAAILNGAHIVRVHHVANSVITTKIYDAILNVR